MAEDLKNERVAHLETTIRFYAASARRWEARCAALELELHSCKERLAALGFTQYGILDPVGD